MTSDADSGENGRADPDDVLGTLPATSRIPVLNEATCLGTGKLNERFKVRLSSGTETDRMILDVDLVHVISHIVDAAVVDAFIPGASGAFRMSVGEDGDGKRPYKWTPDTPECSVVLCPAGGGIKIYEGAAEVRSGTYRTHAKGAVLTVAVRLLDVRPEDLVLVAKHLGQLLDYEATYTALVAGGGASANVPGGLPFNPQAGQGSASPDSAEVAVGDLVCGGSGGDGEEVVGIAVAVSSSTVTLDRSLSGGDPVEISRADVWSVVPISGPKGGPAKSAIGKLCDAAEIAGVGVGPTDLLAVMVGSPSTGADGVEPAADGRYRITEELIDAVITHVAGGSRQIDLPPEA